MAENKPPESHYNLNKLHVIFACVTLGLLSALGLLFLKDYARPWRTYQNDFRGLEIEKTRIKYDAELNALQKNPEYETLSKELEDARKSYQANCVSPKSVEQEIQKLQTENDLLAQNLKFARAELDAARYRHEEAVAHQGDAEKTKAEFEALDKEVPDWTDADLAIDKLPAQSALLSLLTSLEVAP